MNMVEEIGDGDEINNLPTQQTQSQNDDDNEEEEEESVANQVIFVFFNEKNKKWDEKIIKMRNLSSFIL